MVAVHAAAGYGKTTLAAQWADRDPRHHEILRVAPFLDDPAALALHIIDTTRGQAAWPVPLTLARASHAAIPSPYCCRVLPCVARLGSWPSVC